MSAPAPLVDVHVHFQHEASGRADWRESNAARLAYGDRIGSMHTVFFP